MVGARYELLFAYYRFLTLASRRLSLDISPPELAVGLAFEREGAPARRTWGYNAERHSKGVMLGVGRPAWQGAHAFV